MNSLENIRKSLNEYFEEVSQEADLFKLLTIFCKKDFRHMVYDAFFNLITDPTLTPEVIAHTIETFTRELDGFSTNIPIQTLVAYSCIEAVARRSPRELQGPWETLVWMIVKYSSLSNTENGKLVSAFKKTNIETIKWITMMCTKESCPNPCLRLELFRFIQCFKCNNIYKYEKSFRNKVIITLSELCDNYTSLTVDQLPNFSAMDLQFIVKAIHIDIGYLMSENDLHLYKTEIIAALIKLSSMFALLEKEKQQTLDNQTIEFVMGYDALESQLTACISFCGLMPLKLQGNIDDYMVYFIQAVGNDFILLESVIDTLETIIEVSLCFPEEDDLMYTVIAVKSRLCHTFFKSHMNNWHKHQCLREINGGNSPAIEYCLRYFQKNMKDPNDDHDSEFDLSTSDEDDFSDEENI